MNLANLFATISDIPSIHRAHAVFDTIVSFETRADILDTLMAGENISPLEHETWTRYSIKIRKSYKKRHELAHFNVAETQRHGKPVYRLAPFSTFGNTLRNDAKYLTYEEVAGRDSSFRELAIGGIWFWIEANGRRGLPPNIPMPEPQLIVRLKASAAQILEERAQQRMPPAPE